MEMYYDDWYDSRTLRQNIERKTNGSFSINDVLKANSSRLPDNLFINSFGHKTNWRDGHVAINRLASGMMRLGINKGDKVSLLCGDSDKFVLTYLSIIRIGGITVPINTRLATAPGEVEFIVNHSESRMLILEDKFIPQLEQIRKNLSRIQDVVVIGEQAPTDSISWEDVLNSGSEEDIPFTAGGDDQALQLYTSGTTGRPKGAMLSHFNCLAQMEQMSCVSAYTTDDIVQNMLPFPHCGFICFSLSALYAGAGMNIIYPFEPAKCAEFIQKHKTTVLDYVPAMAIMLLNLTNIKDYDFSSLRLFNYGSAPMPYNAIVRMKELWPQAKLQNIFGMTECSAAIVTMKDEHALDKIGGVGRAVPGGEIRLIDEDNKDVAVDEVGEIIFQGPNIMSGYFKNPEATEIALKGGWYHTGDLGKLDEDGILEVVDRSKDMLIRGGENVYPAEVERVLYDLPAVLECAVIGIPDERLGERTKAFIVVKEGASLSSEEVVGHCKKGLALFKVPEIIEFIDELPKTAMSKLNKIQLRSWSHEKEWRAWEHRG
ncbi:MAG: AMP-binding protein [Desulfosarcina sp.]|nr:AMP-binding protein [Desulfobacterales bacterium]